MQRWLRGDVPARISLAGMDWDGGASTPGRLTHGFVGLWLELRRTQGRRQDILEIVRAHLDELNHRDVSLVTRCLHLALSDLHVRGAVSAVYGDFSARDENPESEERKALTTAAIAVTRELARGYRRVLFELQRVPEKTYALCQAHVWSITHRVFELVQAEQHLCALRRMKLEGDTWRDLNRLYFALHERAEVAQKFELAGYLRKPPRAKWLPQRGSDNLHSASIRQLYVAIQVTGMIDPPSWSAQQFSWVQAYLGRSLIRLKLHAPSIRIAGGEIVVVTPGRAAAPQAGGSNPDRRSGLHIDLGPLLRRIAHDIEQQGMGKDLRHAQRNRMLATLSGGERWQLLERLQRKLRYQDERAPRTEVQQFVDMDVYWGCAAVFTAAREPTPVIGEDARQPKEKPWFLVNESSNGMLFRFNDMHGGKPVFVGQLVAYLQQLDAARCGTLHLGYVTRMQRDRSGAMDVAVQRLATETEPATLQTGTRSGHDDIPAVIARCVDGKWRIVLHSRQASSTLAQMHLRHDDYVAPLRLGKMYLYQTEFVVFDLEQFEHL